jgi:predicted dehydrogenase
MDEGKLKTAVLGLNDDGGVLLEAASQIDYFQIQAVADKDTQLAEKAASQYGCRAYDDYRQLLTANQFDCLLVAAGIYSCDEYVRTAMKKKMHILKVAPAARNFEEAAQFVRLSEEEDIEFAVANPSRFAPGFAAFHDFLQEGKIAHLSLISAFCNFGGEVQPAWHTDQKLSGGGVLLRNCYQIIDQIVYNFSVPEQVYSLNTSAAEDRQQRLYRTEDTVVVMMKFGDTLIGNLTAGRTFGPAQQFLKLYGKNKILTVSSDQFIISEVSGKPVEQLQYDADTLCCWRKLLANFALSILQPDKNRLASSGRENLNNMAVIESAYLSAQTGMAEEPARIPEMAFPGAGTRKPTRTAHKLKKAFDK